MLTIAHISDLHCGEAHFAPDLLERAISEVNDCAPDLVICSGDLTTFGFRPEYLQARFTLGLNYYYRGDHAKAAAVFSALPPIYDDLINLGAALAARGDTSGALMVWKRAADRDPAACRKSASRRGAGLRRRIAAAASCAAKPPPTAARR